MVGSGDMGDFELNKAIAEYVFSNHLIIDRIDEKQSHVAVRLLNKRSRIITFDFNDWNDLMPLVVEYKVEYELCYSENEYLVDAYVPDMDCFTTTGKDLQRALAECLLKVLEAKNGCD